MDALCGILDLLLRPFVWLLDKTRNRRLVWKANLPRSALVLEIGSGHNPWPRSNVLCDRHPDDNTERSGPLHRDSRPFFAADATALPFAKKSFDFIYCSHLAEHVEDIGAFLEEIQRVGKAGYLETPNYLFEQTVGTTTHVWALYLDPDGILVAEKKPFPGSPAKAYHGWHGAIARHPLLRACLEIVPELRPMRFWWKGGFRYAVRAAPPFLSATRAKDGPAQ